MRPRPTDRSRKQAAGADRDQRLLLVEGILWRTGTQRVAGVDEAGMGPLAGPVVAAAVILPPGPAPAGIDDSKRLSAAERQRLDGEIRRHAVAVAVAEASVAEIAELNIFRAGLSAMRRAVLALVPAPEHVLVDAREIPGLGQLPQNAFIAGDRLSASIAAASILAKVHRDRLMGALGQAWPGYGFETHKGYGTPEHLAALARLGPCPAHRQSYEALRRLSGDVSPAFAPLARAIAAARTTGALAALSRRLDRRMAELRPAEARKLRALIARKRARL